MDIHKPKPWHGWREFLKEYLIIVVGVLTALAAESVVENLHERRLSNEAREAVRAELNTNITNVGRRFIYESCVRNRLAELRDVLDRGEAGQAVAPGPVGAPGGLRIATQRWQAATAGGRTSLLPSDEQAALARVYNSLDGLTGIQTLERQAWMELDALDGLHRLSPQMLYGARVALAQARAADAGFDSQYRQTKAFAALVGVKGDARLVLPPGTSRPASIDVLCQPLEPHGGR